MKKVVAILLILTGILSIILSMFCFIKTTRGFPSNEVYGGDAYTGIQMPLPVLVATFTLQTKSCRSDLVQY